MSNETTQALKPTQAEIAERAYGIYEREGRVIGREIQHWLEAEAQLLRERQQMRTKKRQPIQLPTFLQGQAQRMRTGTSARQSTDFSEGQGAA